MSPHARLSRIAPEEWSAVYRGALACECGRLLDCEDERLAVVDEFVALAVPALVRLRVIALVADGGPDVPPACVRALSGAAATVVRLLDRALAAHAREVGYVLEAWLEQTAARAHRRAQAVTRMSCDDLPL